MDQFGVQVGLREANAFEGWFTKIDDLKNELMLSVIWGYSTHPKTKHAFIQFQDSISGGTSYISYELDEMKWHTDPFILQIGKNTLSEDGMHLDFLLNGSSVRGNFKFGEFTTIKKSRLKPNIMGLLSYLPNQCNHSIISMGHQVSGDLQMGGEAWKIQHAHGYIEKDWGTGFPKEYVWLQANDWEKSAVVFGYATVPTLGTYAKGFFLVLLHDDKEYRFSSIEGSRLANFKVSKDSFEATIERRGFRLTLKAKQANPVSLVSPEKGEMKSYIKESLEGCLELALEITGQPEITLTSKRASIDVHF